MTVGGYEFPPTNFWFILDYHKAYLNILADPARIDAHRFDKTHAEGWLKRARIRTSQSQCQQISHFRSPRLQAILEKCYLPPGLLLSLPFDAHTLFQQDCYVPNKELKKKINVLWHVQCWFLQCHFSRRQLLSMRPHKLRYARASRVRPARVTTHCDWRSAYLHWLMRFHTQCHAVKTIAISLALVVLPRALFRAVCHVCVNELVMPVRKHHKQTHS